MEEDNFGYSLPPPTELTNEDILQSLRETISSSKRYVFFSFLEAVAISYVAEKCYGKLPEPWNNTVYSSMILLEILAVGAGLYSIYDWRRASKHIRELEQMVDTENKK